MNAKTFMPIYFLVLALISSFAFGQQQDYIIGKLFDAETNEPVVFANIRIKDRAVGIITNVDGSFRIPLRYKEYGDIIEISSMGYETKELPINDFSEDELNILTISPAAISLQEAVVKAKGKRRLNAKQIVQRAIDAIPRNFPTTSFSAVGYYRDYQRSKGQYINLNEAILEVFDQGFDQLDDASSETRLFYFQMNSDFEQDSMARASYDYKSLSKIVEKAFLDIAGGNEFRILRVHDAIRNYNVFSYDFIGTLKTDLINNHSFSKESDTSIDNQDLYRISFKVNYPNYRANGTLYISKLDFAIHKLEYTMYDENERNDSDEKNRHGHKQKVIFDITTDYRKINDKMYLNYISLHNSFILNIRPVFEVDNVGVDTYKRCFVVEYNRKPEEKESIHLPNYIVNYRNQQVKLKRIARFNNEIFLYAEENDERVTKMFEEMKQAEDEGKEALDVLESLDIQVTNVRDTLGNLVNQWTQREYQQFREFFSQQVKPDTRAPFDVLFMDKKKPIYENQNMVKPEEYGDYWMNTPLLEKLD